MPTAVDGGAGQAAAPADTIMARWKASVLAWRAAVGQLRVASRRRRGERLDLLADGGSSTSRPGTRRASVG